MIGLHDLIPVEPSISHLFNKDESIKDYFKNIIKGSFRLSMIKGDFKIEDIEKMSLFDMAEHYTLIQLYKEVRILNFDYFKTLLIECMGEE